MKHFKILKKPVGWLHNCYYSFSDTCNVRNLTALWAERGCRWHFESRGTSDMDLYVPARPKQKRQACVSSSTLAPLRCQNPPTHVTARTELKTWGRCCHDWYSPLKSDPIHRRPHGHIWAADSREGHAQQAKNKQGPELVLHSSEDNHRLKLQQVSSPSMHLRWCFSNPGKCKREACRLWARLILSVSIQTLIHLKIEWEEEQGRNRSGTQSVTNKTLPHWGASLQKDAAEQTSGVLNPQLCSPSHWLHPRRQLGCVSPSES